MDKPHICEKCGERLDESQLVSETDPDLYEHALRDFCLKLREERGEPTPPAKLYHRRHAYRQWGGTSHFYLCGPLHPETDQEYFVHWTGGSMKAGK